MSISGATETLTIRIPTDELQRLRRVAEISQRPIDDVIADTLRANLPPLLEDVPAEMRSELAMLEKLPNPDLFREVNAVMPPQLVAQYDALLEAGIAGTQDSVGRQALVELRLAGDRLMFRKAYAALLLKWRGQRIPTLSDLHQSNA